MPAADLVIRGAREHNLRNVDLTIPRNQLVVMTGVSGSGKSSLAFDTLYAEGQRRYVESLSTYARQFLGQMPKPDVDAITGLAPSISIQQKVTSRNPRSTVGTITEIYDYLRVLFARVGRGHCVKCGQEITAQSTDQILESIQALPEGTKFQVLAPIVNRQKGEFRDLFADLLKQGFLRARVDGNVVNLSDDLGLKKHFKHTIEVVVDRLVAGKGNRTRLAEAIESATRLSGGTLIISTTTDAPASGGRQPADGSESEHSSGDEEINQGADAPRSLGGDKLYSAKYACPDCGLSYEPPSPQLFSFNSPLGMCLECTGLGTRHEFLIERVVEDETKSIAKGALNLLGRLTKVGRWRRHIYEGVARAIEQDCELDEGSFLKTPWQDLDEDARELFLYGMDERHITFAWRHRGGVWKHGGTWDGFLPELLDDYRKAKSPMRRRQLEKYMEVVPCSECRGERLNEQARHVTIASSVEGPVSSDSGNWTLTLPQLCALSIDESVRFFTDLELDDTKRQIAEDALKEIRGRLGFLIKCGLGYLTLDRSAPTLSGGESQRIRLAGQIGCGLVGVLYILDEPSIGLHPRDNRMLLSSLENLRDQGNTVIVVEHDEETMEAADHIIDFGPGPGVRGGEIVAAGTVEDIRSSKRSLTGAFLSGRERIEVPEERRSRTKSTQLKIVGAQHNNLQNVSVEIPLGLFVCVTGVSGSGKSSLCNDILWQTLNRDINSGKGSPGRHKRINGLQHLDKAIDIDQSPIGRTPRSNPATYVKLLDEIRKLYTQLPQSKIRGYKPGRFSFNVEGGRCEACEGHGATKLEMDFLADIWIPCTVCDGKRFNHETLEVRYKDKSIADVLDMDVQEALEHFKNHPKIYRLLQTLHDVGLDYLKLGQPSPTLSGGEAQRIKLARELGKRSTGSTLYLLDEPTTGLHFADVKKLLEVLHGFVKDGNSVLVIEHNLDVIKTADWLIDLGPEGGSGGGTLVAAGTPEEVAACDASHTGRALKLLLARRAGDVSPPMTSNGRGTSNNKRKDQGADAPRSPEDSIIVRGAAQHNLQSIDLIVPRDQMSVFCGPSGSGKTSLAMDTLYAEGQRRYVESLSAYARQFLGQMPKPKVESVSGLSPAIAIEQKTVGATPRSTVGTVTEIYDYLRILFARLGTPYCPEHQVPVTRQTTDEIVERVLALDKGTRLYLAAPVQIPIGQSYAKLWERLGTQGYLRVRINGETHNLDDVPEIDHKRQHVIEAIIDRIKVDAEARGRIADSIETALDVGKGVIHLIHVDGVTPEPKWRTDRLSLHYSCPICATEDGRVFENLAPQNFSFNSPLGWCDACEGLGVERGTNQQVLVANPNLTLLDGAVSAWPKPKTNPTFRTFLEALAAEFSIPLDVPWYQLDSQSQRVILYGSDRPVTITRRAGGVSPPITSNKSADAELDRTHQGADATRLPLTFTYKGLYPAIEEASRVSYEHRMTLQDFIGEKPCSVCSGDRIRDDAAAVRLEETTLPHLCRLPLAETLDYLQLLKLTKEQKKIAGDLLNEAVHRLSFLVDVGLHYLTLDRGMPTLSGGESQRIRLAGQIGRALTGVLYVLDEPTIGLHPRDNGRLIDALHKLRDLGNTVVLVEHDREVLEASDRLFDFGPGSGRFGGNVVADGTPKQVSRWSNASLTGAYLSGKKSIPVPTTRRITARNFGGEESTNGQTSGERQPADNGQSSGDVKNDQTDQGADAPRSPADLYETPPGEHWLTITGCQQNNLRNVDLSIPLGTLSCITGLSGSGKSSLIQETLARAVARHLNRQGEAPGPFDELFGAEHISRVINVDQAPLGATPASNPATYTGVFDPIRELFSRLPEAKIRGYKPGRFSFNRAGGRCDDCDGWGQLCIEMHFLPDVWVTCDTCRGKRYNEETLAVRYKGHSIADVLNLSIGQALELFENIPKIRAPLATLAAIGLDYLTLGQSATTLSGGEAQRVKLAAELCKPNSGRTLYLLDEPTTGLHFDDIAKLLKVLGSLVEAGNTVVVIEHNLDVIKTADWIVDIGPEAGVDGGQIVAQGTPEEIVAHAENHRRAVGVSPPITSKGSEAAELDRTHRGADAPRSPTNGSPTNGSPGLRSWTGELLAPVLEQDERADLDLFDVKGVAKKRKGDVDIARVGRDAAVPWKVDGRKWHTEQRPARSGKPVQWDGVALGYVVDLLEDIDGLKEPNWNDQRTVEVTSEKKTGAGWFFHALTGDEWFVRLYFRVPKKTFDPDRIQQQIDLTPVDDLDDIPVYGRGERVKFSNSKGPFQEVAIDIHELAEVKTSEFRKFVEQAAVAYLKRVEQQDKADPTDVMPWKVLGRKWHESRKGFPSNKRVSWKQGVAGQLFDLLEQTMSGKDIEWGNKTIVAVKDDAGESIAEVQTKRRDGLYLTLLTSPGDIALGQISDLAAEQEIGAHRSGKEAVQLRFDTITQVKSPKLKKLLAKFGR